jgi:hypothetical protein
VKRLIYTVISSKDLGELDLFRLFHRSIRNIYKKEDVEIGVICPPETWINLNLCETHISPTSLFKNLDEDHPFNSVLSVYGENDYDMNKFLIHEFIDTSQYELIVYSDYNSIVCSDIFKHLPEQKTLHLYSPNNSDSPTTGLFAFHHCEEIKNIFKSLYKSYLNNSLFNFGSYIEEHDYNTKLSFNLEDMVRSYVPTPENMEIKFLNFGKEKIKQLPELWRFPGRESHRHNKLLAMEKCLSLCNNFRYNETTD